MATQAQVNPSEETIGIGPLGIRFLLTGEDTNGSVSVFEMTVPARQKLAAPAHKNDAYEETLYGISGVLTWTIDGKAVAVGPGQAVCIPRGAVHRFDNLGTEDAKQLSIVTPAIMSPAYFREAREAVSRRRRRSAGRGPDGRDLPAARDDDRRAAGAHLRGGQALSLSRRRTYQSTPSSRATGFRAKPCFLRRSIRASVKYW